MRPITFLNITAKLLKTQKHQANWRSSASRSYYAMYHEIKQLYKSESIELGKDHGVLHQCLISCTGFPEIQGIGKHIQTLYLCRIKADYELSEEYTRKDAEMAYDLAHKIDRLFLALLENNAKKHIIEEARNFLKIKRNTN